MLGLTGSGASIDMNAAVELIKLVSDPEGAKGRLAELVAARDEANTRITIADRREADERKRIEAELAQAVSVIESSRKIKEDLERQRQQVAHDSGEAKTRLAAAKAAEDQLAVALRNAQDERARANVAAENHRKNTALELGRRETAVHARERNVESREAAAASAEENLRLRQSKLRAAISHLNQAMV